MFWVIKRLPKDVLDLLRLYKGRLFVAGGFIRACIANEKPRDIDLFCDSKELAELVAHRLKGKDNLISTCFAYTICRPLSIQVIHRWLYDDPAELISQFDFTVVQAAIWCAGNENGKASYKSICVDRFYIDIAAKRLVYVKPIRDEEPGGSAIRVLKYTARGYRVTLDSFGEVIARLVSGVDFAKIHDPDAVGEILTGLLYEVDPATNFESEAFIKKINGVE
jgi:hypothetical protein